MTHWLMARQMPDGRWLGNGLNRPPSEYSIISHTALAAGGLKSYPLPGRRSEIADSLRRAREWLLAADAKSAEERGMRLMGLVWTDAPQARVDEAVRAIRERRRPAAAGRSSAVPRPTAYATGLSLYALHVAGVPANRRGVSKGRGVSARHAVSGRHVAGEDALIPSPALFRERVSLRQTSVDFHCGHELGESGDRADVAGQAVARYQFPTPNSQFPTPKEPVLLGVGSLSLGVFRIWRTCGWNPNGSR